MKFLKWLKEAGVKVLRILHLNLLQMMMSAQVQKQMEEKWRQELEKAQQRVNK